MGAGQGLARLGEFGTALEGVRGDREPVVLLVVLLVLLLGTGLLLERCGRLGWQPQLEQVPGRHRVVAADNDDLAQQRLKRRRRRWVLRGGAAEQAAQEPAGTIHPGEP